MASKYSISAVFKLIDNISGPLDRIAGKGNRVGKALKNDFMAAQKSLDKMGQTLATAGKYAVGAGVAAMGAGIAIATKQYIDFDQAVTAAGAKFKDIDIKNREQVTATIKALGEEARRVAAITEYNAVDTAGALEKMAMAGLTSGQSMRLLMGTTNLATAAGMDLTTAVDIATDSLGAFGLTWKDISEDQLAVNLDRVSDVMAKTTNMFNTDMSMMFEAVKKGAPVFTQAEQSLETFSAMVGVLANSGIKGSEAGTALRNIIQGLTPSSSKAADALRNMGINVKDSAGNMNNLVDIMGDFEKAMGGTDIAKEFKFKVDALKPVEGVTIEDQIDSLLENQMGNVDKISKLTEIFGKRTVGSMLILMAEGSGSLRDYTKQLENAGGAAADIARVMRDSIINKIEKLKSGLTELGFKFVEAFQAKGVGLIEKLTEAISKFDPAPIISAFKTVAGIIGSVIGTIWNMREIILGVAIAWGVYKTAMLAAAAIGPILGLVKAVQTLMAAQKGMNVVQAVFNVLLNMNPIGLIITGIGILIGLIILAVKHWEKITEAINENQNKVLALISIFSGPFGIIFSIINELRNNWEMVVETFKTDGIIAGLKALGGVLVSALLAPVQGFLEILAKIPVIGEKIAPAVGKIEEFRNSLKGTNDTIEKPLLPRPVPRQVNSTTPTNPAPAAATPARATTTQNITPPMIPSPATATRTSGTAAQWGVMQPALLNLRAGTNPAPAAALIPGASPWLAEAAVTGGVDEVTPSAIMAVPAVTRTVSAGVSPAPAARTTATGTAQGPVRVPVEYVFPEMLIPADIIKTIMVPVELALASALPPRRAGPLPLAGPVSGSVGLGISPPEAPMTQAEQIVYSRIDNYENVKIEVSPEGGTSARIITPPKSPHVELLISGDV